MDKRMKKKIHFLALIIVAFSIIISGCNQPKSKVDDKATLPDTLKKDTYIADATRFKNETSVVLKKNEESFETMNARIATIRKEIRDEYKAEIAGLEQKNAALKKQIDEYTCDDQEHWIPFRTGINQALHEIDSLTIEVKAKY
jgi:hypothetical protein